jgi:hypothetical protein
MANTKKQVLHVEIIETGKKIIINKEDFNSEIHKQVRVDIAVPEKTDSEENETGEVTGISKIGSNGEVANAEGQTQEEEKTKEAEA